MGGAVQCFALAAAEGGNPLLRVNPGLGLWTLVVFLLLFLALRKWGFGLLVEKLELRDRTIRGAIDEARQQRAEAEKLLDEHRALLARTRQDAAAVLGAAQEQAQRERERLVAEARGEYEKIVGRGRLQLEQETQAALAQVRRAAAGLALDVAAKLLHRNLDQPAQRELAERFISEVDGA